MTGVPNFRFIRTQRVGDALVVDEYIFRVGRRIGTKKYWRCHGDPNPNPKTWPTCLKKYQNVIY